MDRDLLLPLTIAFISGAITLAVAFISGAFTAVGYWATKAMKERELGVKLIELAVSILNEEPGKGREDIRKWAVALINHHSEVKISEEAKESLVEKERLIVREKIIIVDVVDQEDKPVMDALVVISPVNEPIRSRGITTGLGGPINFRVTHIRPTERYKIKVSCDGHEDYSEIWSGQKLAKFDYIKITLKREDDKAT